MRIDSTVALDVAAPMSATRSNSEPANSTRAPMPRAEAPGLNWICGSTTLREWGGVLDPAMPNLGRDGPL